MEPFYSAISCGKASSHFTPGKKFPKDIESAKQERIDSLLLGETEVHYC